MSTFPATFPATGPATWPATERPVYRGGGAWSPTQLFAGGEAGAFYDASDRSTTWQDAAGTIPAVADNDPVGRIDDLSGNNNHATQATAAARPLLQMDGSAWWLQTDGVDDFLGVSFSPTAYPMTLFSVSRRTDSGGEGGVISLHESGTAYKSIRGFVGPERVQMIDRREGQLSPAATNISGDVVQTAEFTASLLSHYVQDNAAVTQANTNTFGAPTDLYLGQIRSSGLRHIGRIYSGLAIDRQLTAAERANLHAWGQRKT